MSEKPIFTKLETSEPALLQGGGSRGGMIKGVRAFDTTYRDPDTKGKGPAVSAQSAATPKNIL